MAQQHGQAVAYIRVLAPNRTWLGSSPRSARSTASSKTASPASRAERPALAELIAYVRAHDTVLVASMDRLARSLADLQSIVEEITAEGATVRFLKESLTFSPGASDPLARFQLQLIGAVAEPERSLIGERQAEGITSAKDRGVYRGRARRLSAEHVADARERIAAGVPKAAVAREFGCSRQTPYAELDRREFAARSSA